MFHKYYLILLLLLSGCNWFANDSKELDDIKFQDSPKVEKPKKLILDESWYRKVDINLSDSADYEMILKALADKFGVRITFYVSDYKNISYVVNQKTFIEVISDICELNGWKVIISKKNAKIMIDSPYLITYSIPFLSGSRKVESNTSVMGTNSNESSFNIGSSANLTNNISIDSFEELQRNLENYKDFEEEGAFKFFINKQAGVVSVLATQKAHRSLAKYIEVIKKNIGTQVLVEAKIFEVSLYNKFEVGIDWAGVAKYMHEVLEYPVSLDFDGGIGVITSATNVSQGSIANVIKLLYKFGEVKSVSNPRLIIGSNSVGILKAVDNKVFFKLKNNIITSNLKGGAMNTISSEVNTVPVGTIILVQPVVDENGRVMIALRPTISEVDEEVEDPAVALMNKGNVSAAKSLIPIVKMRELDTTFTIDDDSTVIIGGLLYSKKKQGFSLLPYLGLNSMSDKKEIAIFLRVQIIDSYINNFDKIYLS